MPPIANKLIADRYHKEFKKIFGINLMSFFNLLTGFDVCSFDEHFVQSPDGKSVRDVVLEKYGEDGVRVINGLLRYKEGL